MDNIEYRFDPGINVTTKYYGKEEKHYETKLPEGKKMVVTVKQYSDDNTKGDVVMASYTKQEII